MDNQMKTPSIRLENNAMFSNSKNILIVVLCILLILSFLGINVLSIFGQWIQSISNIFKPLVSSILSIFGYTAGTVIDKSADLVTTVTKTGIDVAGGAAHSVGDLLINSSKGNLDYKPNDQEEKNLDKKINNGANNKPPPEPTPNSTTNPIQNPISSQKTSWCLVGEYQDKRGCIEIGEADQCLSGQVFPNQKMCLNPTLGQGPPNPLKGRATH